MSTLGAIERLGDRTAVGQHFARPLDEWRLFTVANEPQSRLATAGCDSKLVLADGAQLLGCVRRAVAKQTVQQEDVEKAQRRRGDANRHERIEIHQTHLDVLDAAVAQCVERSLAWPDYALRADRAVELV